MTTAPADSATPLYRQVMTLVSDSIGSGSLRPGDRLPSLRQMSRNAGVSIPTVQQAYLELESQRRIEARPRSGFFVRHVAESGLVRKARVVSSRPSEFKARPLVQRVFDGIDRSDFVPLGIASPSMARPAGLTLNRGMKRRMTRLPARNLGYSATLGEPILRQQIAHHYLDSTGAQVDPEDICVANGGQEALLLALRAVASPGDVIAVETPTYHGILELIDSLGMLAVEVETCPEEGVVVDGVRAVIADYPVKACVFSTTLSNPLGVTMPEADRQRLLKLLAENNVPLIDDDVYGELRFDGDRPTPCQFLSSKANVLTVGSFSKTCAPGYRVGWVIARSDRDAVARLKRAFSCSSVTLPQLTLADFIASGGYARHLRKLQGVLLQNSERMTAAVEKSFPSATRTSKPSGGCILWVELPKEVDSELLFDRALDAGISTAPGKIFSPGRRYRNFLRLSFGHPWSEEIEGAVDWLGRAVSAWPQALS